MSTLFSGHYLRNRSTLDIGVLGYIGIVYHKEHSPEVFHIPPGTPCIYIVCAKLKTWVNAVTSVHTAVLRIPLCHTTQQVHTQL